MNIKSRAYLEILAEEANVISWLNSKMCIGEKRDIAYKSLASIRYRKERYEQAVQRRKNERKSLRI